jgi:hypothetical protein
MAKPFSELGSLRTPSEAVYADVGRMALNWSYTEYMIEILIWRYVGSVDVGHLFTSQMGNQGRSDVLKYLATYEEPDEVGRQTILHGLEGFGILRLSRNKIVHSYNFFQGRDETIRFSGRSKGRLFSELIEYELRAEALHKLVDDMRTWSWFLHQIVDAVTDRRGAEAKSPGEQRPWPEKPPLPESLNPLRPVGS